MTSLRDHFQKGMLQRTFSKRASKQSGKKKKNRFPKEFTDAVLSEKPGGKKSLEFKCKVAFMRCEGGWARAACQPGTTWDTVDLFAGPEWRADARSNFPLPRAARE